MRNPKEFFVLFNLGIRRDINPEVEEPRHIEYDSNAIIKDPRDHYLIALNATITMRHYHEIFFVSRSNSHALS